MKIKLFADGANIDEMVDLYKTGIVQGFTTNPTLMRKSGITDYESWGRSVLRYIPDMPVSFEVLSDYFNEMKEQAHFLSSWGKNVYVKIPITNTKGESSVPLIKELSKDGIKVNVTAILTYNQAKQVGNVLDTDGIISIFAGRIADTGRDPVRTMYAIRTWVMKTWRSDYHVQLLWASPRELLNIFQAEKCGCDIITVTPDILKKLSMVGKNLDELSLDTVKMFYQDGKESGYTLCKS